MTRLSKAFAVVAIVLCSQLSAATSIQPIGWRQLVLDSDFVGIAECTTAGGVVARYVVIESWKGPPAGTEFTLRVQPDYWEPQFPTTLAGERYFMTAYKSAPVSHLNGETMSGSVPLWWRDIPADYRLPLFQGRMSHPAPANQPPYILQFWGKKGGEGIFGTGENDWYAFKKIVRDLIALPPERRKIELLRGLALDYAFPPSAISKDDGLFPSHKDEDKVRTTQSQDVILNELWLLAQSSNSEARGRVDAVLMQGGDAATEAWLRALSDNDAGFPEKDKSNIIAAIESRLNPRPVEHPSAPKPDNNTPTRAELGELRRSLSDPHSPRWEEAFDTLTVHDPESVAKYLNAWKNPSMDRQSAGQGYVLGSHFGWRCGREREKNLKRLLDAEDPEIRVAAAVYLTFENPELGKKYLRTLSDLPGDPGVWAALTLARRGEKSAMPRVLKVFENVAEDERSSSIALVPHRNLQKRARILISNSALESGLPLLEYHDASASGYPNRTPAPDAAVQWWSTYGDRATLHDPWLPLLETQKVD